MCPQTGNLAISMRLKTDIPFHAFVSHAADSWLADHLLVLEDGRIHTDGDTKDLPRP